MFIKNPATLLNKEFDSLLNCMAGFFVGINLLLVNHVQRAFPIQNLTKSRPNFTVGFI